jgi:hypothetical protein
MAFCVPLGGAFCREEVALLAPIVENERFRWGKIGDVNEGRFPVRIPLHSDAAAASVGTSWDAGRFSGVDQHREAASRGVELRVHDYPTPDRPCTVAIHEANELADVEDP